MVEPKFNYKGKFLTREEYNRAVSKNAMDLSNAHSQIPEVEAEKDVDTDDLPHRVLKVLGVGYANAKTTDQIAREVGEDVTRQNNTIRAALKVLRENKIPAISYDNHGFFLCETIHEKDRYCQKTDKLFMEACRNKKVGDELEPVGEIVETLFE